MIENDNKGIDKYNICEYDQNAIDLLIPSCKKNTADYFNNFLHE